MDFRRKDFDDLLALAKVWKKTPDVELETAVKTLDLTGWQDIIQGLRALGMRETSQIVKMTVTVDDNVRFTLEGAGIIQAYCEDNNMANKPFNAMRKETIEGSRPLEIPFYGIRAKLKRETPLAVDDAVITSLLSRWASLNKYFRVIQRFEFVAPDNLGIRFDISIVRSGGARTFQEARVNSAPSTYEAEVELIASRDSMGPEAATSLMIRGTSWMLQGLQRSYVLTTTGMSRIVQDSLATIFKTRGFRYPGPQPATLERRNLEEPEPGVPNLRSGYNVTDKADGLRCLLFVAEKGRIFLVDGGGRVYSTGKEADRSLEGLCLDGEWIRKDRKGSVVSHYYAFDIMALRGDTSVASLPFMIPGSKAPTRHATMATAITGLGTAKQVVKVPANQELQIGIKAFRTAPNIFRDAAAIVLDDAKSTPYTTDGLIFTPNEAPLPLGRGSWSAQLKWKPASHNTIDFLVIVDKERGADGSPLPVDLVTIRDTKRTKALRLFVGSKRDAAFADPRKTLTSGEPLPTSLDGGEYRAVEFRPSEPRDPMAAICYVAIGGDNTIVCDSGDLVDSNMIVEMAYYPEREPGWRWVPMRVRHDKTERLQRGIGGTMNADWVANSIWSSLHNPVTEDMVKTGVIQECVSTGSGPTSTVYYNRKAPKRDLMKTQCLRNFHNDYIKRDILLKKTLMAGGTLCDLAMGKAGDLHKWVALGASHVFGCDYAANNINDPQDGAYARLLTKNIELGKRLDMVFVQADAAVLLKDGSAGVTAEDKTILQQEFATTNGYDVVSCMFALHYMFRDEVTLHGFITNLADTVKVGGYFVGCGFDGDMVMSLLAEKDSVTGRDGDTDIWTITKRYPSTGQNTGLAIDVDFISIGETHQEFLVSWPYLQERLKEVGLELLTPEEQASMGLTASTQLFKDALETAGKRYDMTDALKQYSFLNRWYIFKRVDAKRPAPLSYEAQVRPPILTSRTDFKVESDGSKVVTNGPKVESDVSKVESDVPKIEVTEIEVTKPFLIDPNLTDDRLGPEFMDWPRYLTLGTLVPKGIYDKLIKSAASIGGGVSPAQDGPRIVYPSVEAAIASAKFQVATDKPELGPQIFRVEGQIHQKYETERERLRGNELALKKTVDDQVGQTRTQSGAAKMKGFKAVWDKATWDTEKERVYRVYLGDRYMADERFREIVDRVTKLAKENPFVSADGVVHPEVMLVNGTEYNELGVGYKDGVVVGGDNKVGKWIMELTAES